MTSLQVAVEWRRALRFIAAGLLNTVVCYGLFAALVHLAAWNYRLALVADYGLGIVLGYGLQRLTTFVDRRHVRWSAPKYVAVCLATFLINLALLDMAVRLLRLHPIVAQGLSLAIVTAAAYTLQKQWVFRDEEIDCSAARTLALATAPRRTSEVDFELI
jgi:putative flippase GtrA